MKRIIIKIIKSKLSICIFSINALYSFPRWLLYIINKCIVHLICHRHCIFTLLVFKEVMLYTPFYRPTFSIPFPTDLHLSPFSSRPIIPVSPIGLLYFLPLFLIGLSSLPLCYSISLSFPSRPIPYSFISLYYYIYIGLHLNSLE